MKRTGHVRALRELYMHHSQWEAMRDVLELILLCLLYLGFAHIRWGTPNESLPFDCANAFAGQSLSETTFDSVIDSKISLASRISMLRF